jgi:Ca-activated chloride channel family protein
VLKPFIIGIGQNFSKEFECVGDYYDGSTEEQFQKALRIVISYALNSTSCQVNLLDQAGNPTETNIPMTFYNRINNKIIYQFVHTLNNKGVPDTLLIDPLIKYKIQIHTIPPVYIDSLCLTPGKHTIVSAPTPQGELLVKFPASNGEKSALPVLVRKTNDNATLNVQYTNKKEKYFVGKYDLEILTLPRLYIDNVEVKQSYTTTVEIPAPGNVIIYLPANGYGSIFERKKDKDLELVINLKTEETMQTIQLQPGDYTIVFRAKYVNKSIYTIEKNFTIESNKNTTINLNFR